MFEIEIINIDIVIRTNCQLAIIEINRFTRITQ